MSTKKTSIKELKKTELPTKTYLRPEELKRRYKGVAKLVLQGKKRMPEIAKELGIQETVVYAIRRELFEAAKKGFETVEDYLLAGRPLLKGKKKVLED